MCSNKGVVQRNVKDESYRKMFKKIKPLMEKSFEVLGEFVHW